jgi:signal recognition particle subunit SEC65
MEGRKVYKEMTITYGELAQALTQLGYKNESNSEHFRYVNKKYDSVIVLRANPANRALFKAIISGFSYQLYMQGVIEENDDLAKLVEKNRMANNMPIAAY